MNFELTKEQLILQASAREFLKKECPVSLRKELYHERKALSQSLWQKMAELDWQGIVIPEDCNGIGGSLTDLAVICEEMGRCCCPGPFFSSAVVSTLLILEFGTDAQKQTLLPDMASGRIIVAPAFQETGTDCDLAYTETTAEKSAAGYVINGTKLFVENAVAADSLLCAARLESGSIGLFMIDCDSTGLEINPLDTIGFDNRSEVILSEAGSPEHLFLGKIPVEPVRFQKVMDQCTAIKCIEMAGIVRAVLEMTVDYAKQRKQFNQPIGSFQAIQHHCTNMLMDADCARLLAWGAVHTSQQGALDPVSVSMAKAWANKAARHISLQGHLIHGAIAFCDEHDMHLYYRTAKTGELSFGSDDTHLNRIADHLFA